jgi:hypothetical protein
MFTARKIPEQSPWERNFLVSDNFEFILLNPNAFPVGFLAKAA